MVLVEVFQVNCPGCFLYGLPEAIEIHDDHRSDGLTVLGIATAFEDYDMNNLENLQKLVTTGEVIGETFNSLRRYGRLKNGNTLPYRIPFPVGMDVLSRGKSTYSDSEVNDFIEASVPGYRHYSEKNRSTIRDRARHVLDSKVFSARTFEEYKLRGTPSTILVDGKGILRHVSFGANDFLKGIVESLLNER